MKLIIATVACLIVSVTAVRQFDSSKIDFNNELSVVSYFKNAIEDLSETIKKDGWDLLYIERKEINFTLPVPVIYNSTYLVEDILCHGLSNIVVNKASYNIPSSSLSFDIEMPFVAASVGNALIETTFFGQTIKMSSSGRIALPHIRFVGEFGLNLKPRITVKSSTITFSVAGIIADIKLKIQDDDYSDPMNEFLFKNIPDKLKEYSNEINELFEIWSKEYINDYYLRYGKN